MTAAKTLFPRSSGVLLHPTSLPGRYGVGDLGEWAYTFVNWLESSGQTIWQVLPLGPTSYGDSPYQSLSTFAGNPLLISFDKLVTDGWLTAEDVAKVPNFPPYLVDFGNVINYHNTMLTKAYNRFDTTASAEQRSAFVAWCAQEAYWLDDWALFIALKNLYGGKPWVERIIDLMDILQLYPSNIVGTVVEVLVTVFNEESRPMASKLASDLRAGGVRTELYMQDKALGKQFEYANKKAIPLVAVQGSEEIKAGVVKLKRLSDGTEITVNRSEVAEKVISMLR